MADQHIKTSCRYINSAFKDVAWKYSEDVQKEALWQFVKNEGQGNIHTICDNIKLSKTADAVVVEKKPVVKKGK